MICPNHEPTATGHVLMISEGVDLRTDEILWYCPECGWESRQPVGGSECAINLGRQLAIHRGEEWAVIWDNDRRRIMTGVVS